MDVEIDANVFTLTQNKSGRGSETGNMNNNCITSFI